ncbi:MAG: DsbE family thiol:disulfide interchange protein [Gammaproteobacteria bacterium]|jgi:cytochrome c biogenesis protein CcmG/thiol:disulfide interchange protein DsbE|nr:DsbE family thiol:disulfide interchange protein [Gammaproteobacteria bacterium]MBT3859545.1 DsbE family thiol:disulfide interchange protein [Gammaproteobacteria bacterium]MBT3986561.1 DsbE family thiol:disulfide interchange protein [Gammaproteobacteria bacterium]MBT4256656.1 DsbE family thiol:disulfide interchange protein [Gammaproteobacteria bacterium]MBT4581095.1 DsbE family thiol:disulfide interchange protein [Gammaproteobacteria bacterium]
MGKLKFYIPVISFIALAVLMWRGLYLNPKELPSVLIDKQMPAFQRTTVDGQLVSNENLPDQIFLLNVWGSYCLPCLIEHPTLMRLSEEGDIPVVGINYRDRQNLAQEWLLDNGNPFAFSILDEDGRFGIDLGVYGAPETYLVDSNGVIRFRHVSVLDENVWREDFEPAIAELRSREGFDQ